METQQAIFQSFEFLKNACNQQVSASCDRAHIIVTAVSHLND
jgi:hypothetical protein